MSYGVKIRLEDGTEVPVAARPKKFSLSQHEEGGSLGLVLHIAWGKCELKDDPRAAAAVMYAWPGRESVLLLSGDDGEIAFSGVVSAVGYEDEKVFLKAMGDSGPAPGPLSLSIEQVTTDPEGQTIAVLVDNEGEGEVSLDWGDGTATGLNPGDGVTPTNHAFAAAGNFLVTATDADQPERTASESVSVPFPSAGLEVSVTASAGDPNRMTATIVADNKGAGEVTVVFGDGQGSAVNPGDGTTATTHVYAAGTYTVVTTDTDQPERTVSTEITVPFPA